MAFLQLTLFTILAVVLSYMLAARGGALWDVRLAAWDAALVVNWTAIRATVDGSGSLVSVLGAAYHSLVPQMIVALVTADILSGFATTLLPVVMPAAGNVFDPSGYRHLPAPIALTQSSLIEGLRDGFMTALDLGAMQGIITFPSYHATLAVIFAYAFLGIPHFAALGLLCAGLTIAATPLV